MHWSFCCLIVVVYVIAACLCSNMTHAFCQRWDLGTLPYPAWVSWLLLFLVIFPLGILAMPGLAVTFICYLLLSVIRERKAPSS